MAQGVELNPSHVSHALIESDGVITAAANKLKVRRDSLSKYISDKPELSQLLKELRYTYEEKRKDLAENIYDKYINQWEKYPRLAFQSACYILDSHGEDRGYGKQKENAPVAVTLDQVKMLIEQGKLQQKNEPTIEKLETE